MIEKADMSEPELYFFDMDHTLIDNDCDVSWKEFLVQKKLAPENALEKADYFFDEYVKGQLNFDDFLDFQLEEFIGKSESEMKELAQAHFEEIVKTKIYSEARVLVKKALDSGKIVSLLTATNDVLAVPVAHELGIEHICSTTLEFVDEAYTGKIVGPYCGSEGKIAHAKAFCKKHSVELSDVEYYGDSLSDQYILGAVGYPVVVNPGEPLSEIAEANNWKIIYVK